MSLSFADFASRVHDILAADSGPAGREQVRQLLEAALLTPEIAALVGDDQPNRRVLHADPLGFDILGHVYHEAKRTKPHDHGNSWAIYGQVSGTSIMDEWKIVTQATPEVPGTVALDRTLYLTAGQARLYNEHSLHAPRRDAPAKLIRIEGPGAKDGRLSWNIAETAAATA